MTEMRRDDRVRTKINEKIYAYTWCICVVRGYLFYKVLSRKNEYHWTNQSDDIKQSKNICIGQQEIFENLQNTVSLLNNTGFAYNGNQSEMCLYLLQIHTKIMRITLKSFC